MIDRWLEIIHKSFYPPICLICGGPGQAHLDLCIGCAASLPYHCAGCGICGVRLPDRAKTGLCGKCSAKKPCYDTTRSLFVYLEPVRYLIRSLKFQSNYSCARLLGQMMGEYLRSCGPLSPDLILPVPLHRNRLRERGFNQSIELARPVSKALGIPMGLGVCIRSRETAPQSNLDSKRRKKNLQGAFSVTAPIENKQVAIFDDIVTTGATVDEMAKTLKACGVERIEVWSIARANLGG